MTQVATKTKKKGFRLFNYIGGIVSELKKVVWLSRRETIYLTALVLLVVVLASAVLGALDYGFSELVRRVFIGS